MIPSSPRGEIGVQTIPGGDYAVATHIGPYAGLAEMYSKLLGQWLPRSGRTLRNVPLFEVYVNDPETTDPKDLMTDVYVPLEPATRSAAKEAGDEDNQEKRKTKVDLYKVHKQDYAAPRKPVLLNIKQASYLSIEGKGEPGGSEFTEKIGALYGVAFTVKMTRKFAGEQDYAVSKLEAQWWGAGGAMDFITQPKKQWHWKLLIRTPDLCGQTSWRKPSPCCSNGIKGNLCARCGLTPYWKDHVCRCCTLVRMRKRRRPSH